MSGKTKTPCVYLALTSKGIYKLGMSERVGSRIRLLQTYNVFNEKIEIESYRIIECQTRRIASMLEFYFMRKFQKYLIYGREWFDLPYQALKPFDDLHKHIKFMDHEKMLELIYKLAGGNSFSLYRIGNLGD